MEFTTKIRKRELIDFMKVYQKQVSTTKNRNLNALLSRKLPIAKGVEGQVFHGILKNGQEIAIKNIKIYNIIETKKIEKQFLTISPTKLYNLFLTVNAFDKPIFTELISQTLINQLIFQKISPHYTMNYYWEYKNKQFNLVNEYANFNTFDNWIQQNYDENYWYNALFQIMIGLIGLKKFFNMTHVDCHLKNILVQRVKPGGYWTYILNKKKYYLPNLGFVFLLNDFGFAWIPQKLTIDWWVDATLQHVTKIGHEFYDLLTIFEGINYYKHVVPPKIKRFLKKIIKKDYYKFVNVKKNINSDYNADGMTLEKSIQLFHTPNLFKLQITNDKRIESFNLDKTFDKTKVPKNFTTFVV